MAIRPPWENERYANIVEPSVKSKVDTTKCSTTLKEQVLEGSDASQHHPSTQSKLPEQQPLVNNDEALIIAKRQKALIWVFLLALLTGGLLVFAKLNPQLTQIIGLLISVTVIWFNARLCLKIYKVPTAIILIILSFFPTLNLLVMLVATLRASKILRSKGFRIGFMGADI